MFKMRIPTSLVFKVSMILIPHTPRRAEVFGRHAFDGLDQDQCDDFRHAVGILLVAEGLIA
jgi:hypothetical protein